MIDYYRTLGLPFGSSIEQIKSSYREYAKHFHPDKHGNSSFFTERFKEVQGAYEILSDPKTREEFESTFKRINASSKIIQLERELQSARLTISQQTTAMFESNSRIRFLESEIADFKLKRFPKTKSEIHSEKQPPSRWVRAWKVYRKHNAEKEPDRSFKEEFILTALAVIPVAIWFWIKSLF